MDIKFAIFPKGLKMFIRYCDHCGTLLGGVEADRNPCQPGRPTKNQKETLRALTCSKCESEDKGGEPE